MTNPTKRRRGLRRATLAIPEVLAAALFVACGGPAAPDVAPAISGGGTGPIASSGPNGQGASGGGTAPSSSAATLDGPSLPATPMTVQAFASEDVRVEYVQFSQPSTPLLRDANASLSKEAMLLHSAWKSDHEHWKKSVLRAERERGCGYTSKCEAKDVRVTEAVVSGFCRGAGQCGTGVLPSPVPFVGFVFLSDGRTSRRVDTKDLFVDATRAFEQFQKACRSHGSKAACDGVASNQFSSLPFFLKRGAACFELQTEAPTCIPFEAFGKSEIAPAVITAAKTLPNE